MSTPTDRLAAVSASLLRVVLNRRVSVRRLAREMGTSASQVQRILTTENPANLTLGSLFRAADALDVDVEIVLRERMDARERG